MQTMGLRLAVSTTVHPHAITRFDLCPQVGHLVLQLRVTSILALVGCPAYSLTAPLACTGSSSSDHCNAHGGRQLYQDMRTRARAYPAIATPAPDVARLGMPVWDNAVHRVRHSLPSAAAGPSAPATAERRQSSGPAGSVRPSATETNLRASSGASRTALHCRMACPEHPFNIIPSTANQQSCKMVTCHSGILHALFAVS